MANCKASGFLRLRGLGCNDRFGPVALTRVSYTGPVYAPTVAATIAVTVPRSRSVARSSAIFSV